MSAAYKGMGAFAMARQSWAARHSPLFFFFGARNIAQNDRAEHAQRIKCVATRHCKTAGIAGAKGMPSAWHNDNHASENIAKT